MDEPKHIGEVIGEVFEDLPAAISGELDHREKPEPFDETRYRRLRRLHAPYGESEFPHRKKRTAKRLREHILTVVDAMYARDQEVVEVRVVFFNLYRCAMRGKTADGYVSHNMHASTIASMESRGWITRTRMFRGLRFYDIDMAKVMA